VLEQIHGQVADGGHDRRGVALADAARGFAKAISADIYTIV
jgi:hypothetical protein